MSEVEEKTPAPTPATRSEIVQQIAKALAERRSARSLTLEKISQTIKIRLPYLQALERGEWDELPGEVYVRGFIRRYAQYLGMDGDKMIAPYLQVSQSPVEKTTASSPAKTGSDFNRAQLLWIVVALGFFIAFLKVLKQERAVPLKTKAAVVKAEAAKEPPPPAAVESPKTEPAKAAAMQSHEIKVFSPYPLWLRVTAGEKMFEGFIAQSSSWSWKADGQFTVRLGHTKQVVMSFDGKAVPLQDDQKKITLPAE